LHWGSVPLGARPRMQPNSDGLRPRRPSGSRHPEQLLAAFAAARTAWTLLVGRVDASRRSSTNTTLERPLIGPTPMLARANQRSRHAAVHRVGQLAIVALAERLDHGRCVHARARHERVGARAPGSCSGTCDPHRLQRPSARTREARDMSLSSQPNSLQLTSSRSIGALPARSPMPSAAPCTRVAPASTAAMQFASASPRSRCPCQSIPTAPPCRCPAARA
jgi:hypothetical protein